MLKDQDVEAAGVGHRVFIKGLAATGALGRRLPTRGFTYDVSSEAELHLVG